MGVMSARLALTFAVLLFTCAIVSVSGASSRSAGAMLLALSGTSGNGAGFDSQLVRVNPRTLVTTASGVAMPGYDFGLLAARSPDRSFVALDPVESKGYQVLFVLDARRLRIVARRSFAGDDLCALDWLSPRRLVAVVGVPRCSQRGAHLRVVVLDPIGLRILRTETVTGPPNVVASALATHRFVLLLAPIESIGPIRVVSVTTNGVRMIATGVKWRYLNVLPSINQQPALVVTGEHALIVQADNEVADVNLATGRVVGHVISGSRPPGFALRGRVVSAVWAGPHLLAVAEGVVEHEDKMAQPYGVELVDTRGWRSTMLAAHASAVAATGDTLLTFGGRGIRGYTSTGTARFTLLTKQRVDRVMTYGGRYAYADAEGLNEVIDTRAGRSRLAVEAPSFIAGLLP
jgi:hypothetical protein